MDALGRVDEKLGGNLKGLNFNKLGEDIDNYTNALKQYNAALSYQETAQEALTKAQDAYTKALQEGTEAEQNAAKKKVEETELTFKVATSQVQGTAQMLNEAKGTLSESDKKLIESMQSIQNMAQSLASGSASSAWNSIPNEIKNKAITAIQKAVGGKSDLWSQIIGLILSLLETLKEGIGTLIKAIIDSIGDAIYGILHEIGSGKFFAQIAEAIYNLVTQIVQGVLDLFSGGSFSRINWSGGNEKAVKEATERNTRAIEANTFRVEKLKDALDKSAGVNAVTLSEAAIETQKAINELTSANLKEQMNYHSAHHSNDSYLSMNEVGEGI